MDKKPLENQNETDNLCIVCFKNVEIYSIGSCDHQVCFECSTRMRILCKQNECPICRKELPKVIFTKHIDPFTILYRQYERSNLQDHKFGIIFTTSDIQKAYGKLLEHRCYLCKDTKRNWTFKTFDQLANHMRRDHELFYCDICTEHLKIFSFERKCYNRQELAYHRRKGDLNDKSHRGHPICEFCDTRFMDSDELFRHLRRNHLFCHFCDADGKHLYYNTIDDIRKHFKEEHFLCEEGECKSNLLTAVFRTDIDLKAHVATEHSKYMSKSATRQARTLELEFTMAPRPRSDAGARNRRLVERRFEDESVYNLEPGGAAGGGAVADSQIFMNPLTSDQFPALGRNSSDNTHLVSKNYTKFGNAAFNRDDFPTLGGPSTSRPTPALTITTNSAGASAPEVTITRTVRKQQLNQKPRDNFPALGGQSKPSSSSSGSTVRLSVNSSNQQQPPNVSIQVNQKSNGAITTHITTSAPSTSARTEVFPALRGVAETVKQPKWVQPKTKKQEEPKSSKVAARPVLETSDLSSFPSLAAKGKSDKSKKTSSVTVPVDSWVNLNSMKNGAPNNNKKGKSEKEKLSENNGRAASAIADGEVSKKADITKKNQKGSRLDSKLENLRLVEIKNPETAKGEDNKKPKKKSKNKINAADNENDLPKPTPKEEVETVKNESTDINHNKNQTNKNGMTKKRSELKIGTLTNNVDEFPSLGSTPVPPGFSTPQVKPPPGFNGNFPPLGFSNDLTFTSSSGQSYAISPTAALSYKQPHNFQSRNQNLIRCFMEVLNDNESIRNFKTLSDNFRKGEMSAKKYHEQCRSILGSKFSNIFPELLVLLPDIGKQQELYKELNGQVKENLVVCENCQQVIFKWELSEHYNYHRLENHFPSLGSAQQINSAWKK